LQDKGIEDQGGYIEFLRDGKLRSACNSSTHEDYWKYFAHAVVTGTKLRDAEAAFIMGRYEQVFKYTFGMKWEEAAEKYEGESL
jgi:hypothetical protein